MYNSYFGFREKPFKLVPNPDYLFLSKSHEIALAHLTYATEHGEGFVVITGEVGTGKTTLCRNFLEGLDEQTASAYIFNPRLESAQLLASICGEFGIQTGETSIKALLDLLNTYLIDQNAAGFKVVVLIDEAQGLSVENLELVRMLSNLETTRSKLLQIILVGQPELGDKLDSYELRQLAQRISLNYHLSPLAAKEAEAYIQHRLGIATQRKTTLFTANACRSAYHYSGGIPRLINIVCDRALLLAYSHNRPRVNKTIMQAAIRELLTRGQAQAGQRQWPYLIGGAALLLVVALAVVFMIWQSRHVGSIPVPADRSQGQDPNRMPAVSQSYKIGQAVPVDRRTAELAETAPENTPPVGNDTAETLESPLPGQTEPGGGTPATGSIQPAGIIEPADGAGQPGHPSPASAQPRREPALLSAVIERLDNSGSRKHAVHSLLSLWGQPRPDVSLLPNEMKAPDFIDLAARQYGLRAYAAQWNWALIEKLDLPMILELKHPASGENVYLTLVGEKDGSLRLSAEEKAPLIDTDLPSIREHLTGRIYIFWKNTLGFDMIIGDGADQKAVLGVQHLLRQIGYAQVPMSSVFDATTREAVRTFQRKNHLDADGLVRPLTKIMLLREAGTSDMPHLIGGKRADS